MLQKTTYSCQNNHTYTHPHITKPTLSRTYKLQNPYTHPHITKPTLSHTYKLQNPYTHPHITKLTRTHNHSLHNKLKQPHYNIHTKRNSHVYIIIKVTNFISMLLPFVVRECKFGLRAKIFGDPP
jgi:hypothetical protein